MRNTRPQCFEIPSVYVALAIKRAIERKAAALPGSGPVGRSRTRQIEGATSGRVGNVRPITPRAPSKRFLARIKLIERPRKIA